MTRFQAPAIPTSNPSVNFLRPLQCVLNIVADVLSAHHVFKLRLMDQLRGLLASAAQNQRSPAGMKLSRDFLDREQASGIEGICSGAEG